MERTLTPEERIKRAEEIYNRRNYYRNNYQARRVKEEKIDSEAGKRKLIKKMVLQMIVCTIIYAIIFTISNSEQIFSRDIINKAKEILSYDISFDSLRNIANSYFNSLKVNPDENNEQVNEEINNTENNNIQEVINSEVINETQEGIGGTDEPEQTAEEKTQEQLDIEYIKQNINIIWPLTGVITSGFGTRTPTDIVSANHYGIDIAGNIGDTIIAAVDGTVTLASGQGDYGNHLKIENGEIATLYAHCNKLYVEEGATVKQGDKIAEVGETGRATGPHLHFEIRRQDRFVNPEEILS